MDAAEVGPQQAEDVRIDDVVLHETDGRNDQAFLIDLGRHPHAAGGAAPDIRVVRHVGQEPEQVGPIEDRRNQGDVVEVHPAGEGIVGQQMVPFDQVGASVGRDCLGNDVDE